MHPQVFEIDPFQAFDIFESQHFEEGRIGFKDFSSFRRSAQDTDGNSIEEIAIARLRQPAFAPHFGIEEFALNSRRETREVVFEDIVVRAGFHRLHRDIFADGAAHQDKGQIDSSP
jgi:hypothetical protein